MTDPDQPPDKVDYTVQVDQSPTGRAANDQILANVSAQLDQHLDCYNEAGRPHPGLTGPTSSPAGPLPCRSRKT